jgi:hypothetical protein
MVVEHKENHIGAILSTWPADHYVMVDDKARLLGKFKQALGDRITTVHVLQGSYAAESPEPGDPDPDERIPTFRELGGLAVRRGATDLPVSRSAAFSPGEGR